MELYVKHKGEAPTFRFSAVVTASQTRKANTGEKLHKRTNLCLNIYKKAALAPRAMKYKMEARGYWST